MKIIVRQSIIAFIFTLVLLLIPIRSSFALVDMRLSVSTGEAQLERNSSYTVQFAVQPDNLTEISQVYAYFTYDSRIFENVSLTDRMGLYTSVAWETNYANPSFDVVGDLVTAQYLKANTQGDNWSPGAGEYILHTFNFKIKKDAPLGNTGITFTIDATISDQSGGTVTGNISNCFIEIVEDSTPPVTSAAPPGGYYNTNRQISLSINEEGTIYHTTGGGEPDTLYTAPVNIIGDEGTVTTTVLCFRGVDEPDTHNPNWEATHCETYHIDKEPPEIHNVAADPAVIGMGGTVTVTFDVTDLSGVLGNNGRPNYVRLGGQPMSWVSGADTGSFEYRRTINGAETSGDVEIMVTDQGGNSTLHTAPDLVAYDLDGPTFTVTPNPDPVYLMRLLHIDVQASEPLSEEPPVVTVGGEPATLNSQNGQQYDYTYLVNGRGWEASFSFLRAEDSDGDGMPDWWEDEYTLNPFSAVGDDGAAGDPDGDGWANLAEYRFYEKTGKMVDPKDAESGGQAIPLHHGWNLISYTVNTCWYSENIPTSVLSGVEMEQISGGDWGNFYNFSRFKETISNFIATMTRHPDNAWTYYGYYLPDWQNSLDYTSPDEGLWINMEEEDLLILEGPRVTSSVTYPQIGLSEGWNMIGVMPQTKFYVNGYDNDAEGPSDMIYSQGYSSVEAMLKAAFNLTDSEFNKIDCIQILYPAPYGVRAYDSSVPWFFWSLKFVMPGYGCWIKLKDGETHNLHYREP